MVVVAILFPHTGKKGKSAAGKPTYYYSTVVETKQRERDEASTGSKVGGGQVVLAV